MRRKRYKLSSYNTRVIEKRAYYLVWYYPKVPHMFGAGGQIKVSKADCKIIGVELYQ
jgi:hypothetical protein